MCFRNHLLTSATTTPISLLLLICFIIATKTICLHAAEPSKDDFAHKWTRRYSNPHSSHQEQLWPADNGQSSSTSLSVNHRTIRATTTINICDSVCNCTKENEIFVGIECSFATDNVSYAHINAKSGVRTQVLEPNLHGSPQSKHPFIISLNSSMVYLYGSYGWGR